MTARTSAATRLVALGRARWRFATTTVGQAVAIDLTDAEAIIRVESPAFRSVLAAMFSAETGSVPSQEQLRDAITVLVGIADAERIDDPWPPSPADESETTPTETYDDVPDELGAQVLDDIRTFATDYVSFPSEAAADSFVLWAAHTHAIDAFDTTPRLVIRSAEKQSGKTRCLEVLELLVRRPLRMVNMSLAYMCHQIDRLCPTLLHDEFDAIWGPKAGESAEDKRAVINAGTSRGAMYGRMWGDGAAMEPREFPTYAPMVLAGIGNVPETIGDRAIDLHQHKRAPYEQIKPFRAKRARAEAEPLQRRLAAWAQRHLDDLNPDPPMPAGFTDRPADVWAPLIAIADAAGGHWPARARAAAVELTGRRDETSIGVSLLGAIRLVFTDLDAERIPTSLLVARLNDDEAAPWATWNRGAGLAPADLARRLKAYGIGPAKYRLGPGDPRPEGLAGETVRGYEHDHFADAFTRYLAPPPPEGGTGGTPERDSPGTPDPLRDNECSTVPPVPPNTGDGASTPGEDDQTDDLRAALADDDEWEPISDEVLDHTEDEVIQRFEDQFGAEVVDTDEPPPLEDDADPDWAEKFRRTVAAEEAHARIPDDEPPPMIRRANHQRRASRNDPPSGSSRRPRMTAHDDAHRLWRCPECHAPARRSATAWCRRGVSGVSSTTTANLSP